MIFLLLSFFKPSLGNEIIYSDKKIYYLAELRTILNQSNNNSSFIFSLRSGMISPPDTFYLSIDRALMTLKYKGFEIFLGRENLSWGYGLFYSPYSYSRSIASPLDVELLRKGHNIVGARYQNVSYITPELLFFLPRKTPDFDSLKVGLRANYFSGDLEFHVPLVYATNSIFSGIGTRYSIFDFTLFIDYSLTYSNKETSHSIVTGLNRYFGDNFFLQAEYFYNNKGLGSNEYDNLPSDILQENILFGYTGKHYLYSSLQYLYRQENTISLFSLIHPLWKSGLWGLSLSTTRFTNSLFMFNFIKIIKGREFEYIPTSSIYSLEFRYYF